MVCISWSCKNLRNKWCSFLSLHPCMSSIRVITEIFLVGSCSTASTALAFPLRHQIKTSVSISMEPRPPQALHQIEDGLILVFPHSNGGVVVHGAPPGIQRNRHDDSFDFSTAGKVNFLPPPEAFQDGFGFIPKIDNRRLHCLTDYFHQDSLSTSNPK